MNERGFTPSGAESFKFPERNTFKQKVIREASRLGAVDTALSKRAEWVVSSAKVADYLRPKIKFTKENATDVRATKVEQSVTVLCLGAGKGHEMDELDMQLPGSEIIGLDPNDYMTKPVKGRLEKLAHKASYASEQVRAENLQGIPDNSVDGATLFFVMHHIDTDKYDKVMSELYRVTKDDGKIFIAEDLVDSKEEEKVVTKIDRKLNFEISAENPHNYKNIPQWTEFFRQYGFKVVEVNEQKPDKVRHAFFVLEKIPDFKKPDNQ
jgi:ubiquinone/menaquinone biosynthesis C-methylase UbiE